MPLLVVLGGCGAHDDDVVASAPPVTEECADDLALPDGRCIRPGIPADACAPGFVHDGASVCEPILPPEPCPPGLMAVPGDMECRPVMPCGTGRWGDIPIDESTIFVDAAYAAGASDGSAERPWTTIAAAVSAAPMHALIAIAAGAYVEDVVMVKPLRLWGVCPSEVEIIGVGMSGCPAAVCAMFSDGAEFHGVAMRGDENGFFVARSQGVLVDRVWIHDTGGAGARAQATLGDGFSSPTSMRIVGSLIEQSVEAGVIAIGAAVEVEATAQRGRVSGGIQGGGVTLMGCPLSTCDPPERGSGSLRGVLVEANEQLGVLVQGSDALVEASVVRDNQAAGGFGRGIHAQPWDTDRAQLAVRTSVIERNREVGIGVSGSEATVELSTLRDTAPGLGQVFGRGMNVELCEPGMGCTQAERAHATVRSSVIERNHDAGLAVLESDVTVEGAIVRDTLPEAATQVAGSGISVLGDCEEDAEGAVTCEPTPLATGSVVGTLIENNHFAGFYALAAEAHLEDSIVRITHSRASDQMFGIGVVFSRLTRGSLRHVLVEQSRDNGVLVGSSDAVVEHTWVRDTLTRADGLFGDGITVSTVSSPGSVTLSDTRIDNSARAGLSCFGAGAALASTTVQCAPVELDIEILEGLACMLEDRGDNLCGCPTADTPCKAVSAGLEPASAPF